MPGDQLKTETLAVGVVAALIRARRDRQQFTDPHGAGAGHLVGELAAVRAGRHLALVLAAQMERVLVGTRRLRGFGCGLALASLVVHRRSGLITVSVTAR